MSSKALRSSVLDFGSLVCTTDRISLSETYGESIDLVGEDFVQLTNSQLLKRYLDWQDKTFGTRNIKRDRSTMSIDIAASATGSNSHSLPELSDMEKFDLDSTAISYIKRPRIEV